MKITWRNEIVNLCLLLVMFIVSGITWTIAPERIPVHWSIMGQADGYGNKFVGLFALPLIALVIYCLPLLLNGINPQRFNYEHYGSGYRIIWTALLAFFTGVDVIETLFARGIVVLMTIMVPLMVGLLLIVIGNFFGKLRQNHFAGIRTPWTLSSKEAWNKTHNLGGKTMVVFGLALVIASFLPHLHALYIAIIALIVADIVLLISYSYLVWKSDPTKNTIEK